MSDIGVEAQDLLEIGARMAQELQELVEDGEDGGCNMGATRALLEEWEDIYRRANARWQRQLATLDTEAGTQLLKGLDDCMPNILTKQAG